MSVTIRGVLRRAYDEVASWYLRPLLRREWKHAGPSAITERPMEYQFSLEWLWRTCPSHVLDVGSGWTCWPRLLANCGFRVTATDLMMGSWPQARLNTHYYVVRDDITRTGLEQEYDAITCISVLEHIPAHDDAVRNMLGLLRPGGHLIMTFPYSELRSVENAYKLPDAGYGQTFDFICRIFSRTDLSHWIESFGCRVVAQDYFEIFSGDLWTVGHRLRPPRRADAESRHHLTCVTIQKT